MKEQAIEPYAHIKKDFCSGEYVTLVDILSNAASRLIGQKQATIWLGAGVICGLIMALGFGIALALGERYVLSGKLPMIQIAGVALAYVSLVIFSIYTKKLFEFFNKHLIDCFLNQDSLANLTQWLGQYCSIKLHAVFCVVYGLVIGSYSAATLSTIHHVPTSYGLNVLCCLVTFIWGIPMYWLFVFIVLPFRLNDADYHFFKADPASSAVITHISSIFTGLVYLYGVVALGSMIYLAYADLLTATTWVVTIVVAWLPIILLFITGQWLLRNLTTRARFVALSEIQKEIENIQQGSSIADKETMEKVNRLLEYHDRIKGSKYQIFNFRATLDFLNSLLLPVIGAIVGNIEAFLQNFPAFSTFLKSLFR